MLLLTRPSGSATAAGIGFALLAGAFWAAYILLSARVGRVFPGGRGLALAMGIAALLMIVPGTAAAGGDLFDPGAAAVGAATGVLSSVIPYSLELEALRRIAVGTFGVLMSMEPAVAALIGLIALGQGLGRGRRDRDLAGRCGECGGAGGVGGETSDGGLKQRLARSQAARRRRRKRRPKRSRARPEAAEISTVGCSIGAAPSNDGMWRSIWASRQALHEHSGTDMPVVEQTVIRVP